MTKRVGGKQECGPSAHIEETLLDLVRRHGSHDRYKTLVRCVAVRPSADLHDDRPAPEGQQCAARLPDDEER